MHITACLLGFSSARNPIARSSDVVKTFSRSHRAVNGSGGQRVPALRANHFASKNGVGPKPHGEFGARDASADKKECKMNIDVNLCRYREQVIGCNEHGHGRMAWMSLLNGGAIVTNVRSTPDDDNAERRLPVLNYK